MALEVSSDKAVCYKCGTEYSRHKGYFPVSYAILHKGVGYIPVCKSCIDTMYDSYLSQCNDAKTAVRQMCRKLDLYWSDSVFDVVSRKSTTRTMMTQYIAKINTVSYAGKSYDDTLRKEGTLWGIDGNNGLALSTHIASADEEPVNDNISQESKSYWGLGFSNDQYAWLDQKKAYYEQKFPEIFTGDVAIGNDILIRQLCIQEVSNMQDIANGKSTSQGISTLNNIIGSLNLKPSQNADAAESALLKQPLGVLAKKIEERHPIKHNSERENELVRYVLIWFYGHMAKSQGISNIYSKMYEDEMVRLRVEHPDLNSIEDDDEFLSSVYELPQSEGDG